MELFPITRYTATGPITLTVRDFGFDSTLLSNATWGSGSDFAWTFDIGAGTNPVLSFSGSTFGFNGNDLTGTGDIIPVDSNKTLGDISHVLSEIFLDGPIGVGSGLGFQLDFNIANATFDFNTPFADCTITMDGTGNDPGSINYKSDSAVFRFDKDVSVTGTLSADRLIAIGFDTLGSLHLLGTSTTEFEVAAYYTEVIPPAGSNKHELKLSGLYTGTAGTYTFKITDVTGGAEQFQWDLDGGGFSADVPVTDIFTLLTGGLRFAFVDSGSDAFILNDEWTFNATNTPVQSFVVDTANNIVTVGGNLVLDAAKNILIDDSDVSISRFEPGDIFLLLHGKDGVHFSTSGGAGTMLLDSTGNLTVTGGLTVDTDLLVVDAVADTISTSFDGGIGQNVFKFINTDTQAILGDATGAIEWVNNDAGNERISASIEGVATASGNFTDIIIKINDLVSAGSTPTEKYRFSKFGFQIIDTNAASQGAQLLSAFVDLASSGSDPVVYFGNNDSTPAGAGNVLLLQGGRDDADSYVLRVEAGKVGSFEKVFEILGDSTTFILGPVGIGEAVPETLTEWTSTVPYLTLHNSTEEDSDGGRESRINFKGEQSGAEETTLARIEVSHDGGADDEKGKIVFSTNTGSDTDTPTTAMTISANGVITTVSGRIKNTTRYTTTQAIPVSDDVIFANTDGSAWTATLPTGVEGQSYRIINSGSSGNQLTIAVQSGEDLLGVTDDTFILNDGETLVITFNATDGWY